MDQWDYDYVTKACVTSEIINLKSIILSLQWWKETYSKRNLQILSSPYIHSCVIGANLKEKLGINCKQSTSHGGGFHLPRFIVAPSFLLIIGYLLPFKLQPPVESPSNPRGPTHCRIFKLLPAYDVNHWAHYCGPIPVNPFQHWFQPPNVTFTVWI